MVRPKKGKQDENKSQAANESCISPKNGDKVERSTRSKSKRRLDLDGCDGEPSSKQKKTSKANKQINSGKEVVQKGAKSKNKKNLEPELASDISTNNNATLAGNTCDGKLSLALRKA